MRLARLSIRIRLTLGATLIAAAVFAVALVAIHVAMTSLLADSNENLAASDVGSYATEIKENPTGIVDDTGEGVLVYARSPSGQSPINTLPHPIQEIVEHRAGTEETFRTDVAGVPFVVVGRTVTTASGDWSLWAARSEASSLLAISALDRVFFVGAVVLLILFAVLAWWLAAAALRPVERMRQKADELKNAPLGPHADPPRLPVGAARDELSELATTLNDFLARVQDSAEREKQMVSDAAHELRTPLAALRTQLELAHDDFEDAESLSRHVTAAETTVARLSSLTNNLLELSRLEAGEGSPPSSAGAHLVRELLGSVDRARLLALARSVEVEYSVDELPELWRFTLSPETFARLVDNLLANAVSAAARGGSVAVGLSTVSNGIVLTVADDGAGMPDDFIPRAFDRFSRADESRTSDTGGSGLGLSLVAAIVESAG